MIAKVKVEGVEQLQQRIDLLLKKWGGKKPEVTVGYTASYAIFVHENLEARHTVGQAKYLEQPFRQIEPTISRRLIENMLRGMELGQALYVVGLLLQRESQLLVPVDTGNLKGSAFTILEYR